MVPGLSPSVQLVEHRPPSSLLSVPRLVFPRSLTCPAITTRHSPEVLYVCVGHGDSPVSDQALQILLSQVGPSSSGCCWGPCGRTMCPLCLQPVGTFCVPRGLTPFAEASSWQDPFPSVGMAGRGYPFRWPSTAAQNCLAELTDASSGLCSKVGERKRGRWLHLGLLGSSLGHPVHTPHTAQEGSDLGRAVACVCGCV